MRAKCHIGSWVCACLFALLAVGSAARAEADMNVNITAPQANPAEIGVAGNTYYYTTLNFDCQVYFWPDSPPDAPTYDWNWGDNTQHGNTKAASHSWAAPGTYTVTITVHHDGYTPATATRTVYAVGGDFTYSTQELRWYGGEAVPGGYKAECVSPTGQPGNIDYHWFSYSGRISAEIGQGLPEATMSAEQGGATPVGDGDGSEQVLLGYHTDRGGYYVYSRGGFTVYQPKTFVQDANHPTKHEPWGDGFLTTVTYLLENQFGGAMGVCPVNEAFGVWHTVWVGETWADVPPGGHTYPDEHVYDYIWRGNIGGNPANANPGNPLDGREVDWVAQTWRAGSETSAVGIVVADDTLHRFPDHAEIHDFQGR